MVAISYMAVPYILVESYAGCTILGDNVLHIQHAEGLHTPPPLTRWVPKRPPLGCVPGRAWRATLVVPEPAAAATLRACVPKAPAALAGALLLACFWAGCMNDCIHMSTRQRCKPSGGLKPIQTRVLTAHVHDECMQLHYICRHCRFRQAGRLCS